MSKNEIPTPTPPAKKITLDDETFTALVDGAAEVLEKKLTKGTEAEDTLFSKVGRGELSMTEYLVWSDRQERKDQRLRDEKREREHNHPGLTAEQIGEHVKLALKDAGVSGKHTTEEIPEWAKKSMEQQENILNRMTKDDENKEKKEFAKEVTAPIVKRLDKQDERQARQDDKIALLSKAPPAGVGPPKSAIDHYIEGRKALKDAGILKDEKQSSGNLMLLDPSGKPMQGIPVTGELPVALVYGPYIVETIANNIERHLTNIAKKFGLTSDEPETKQEPLITIPEKPTPATKPTEKTAVKPKTPETLVKIPEKPEITETATIEVEGPVKEVKLSTESKMPKTPLKPPELVCVTCGTPVTKVDMKQRGIRYRCPKCKKLTKTKEKEKNASETKPDN